MKLRPPEPMVVIPIGLDCRKPGQRDPWKPKPDYSGYEALAGLGSLGAGQTPSQNLQAQMQQERFGQGGVRNWPFGGIF